MNEEIMTRPQKQEDRISINLKAKKDYKGEKYSRGKGEKKI